MVVTNEQIKDIKSWRPDFRGDKSNPPPPRHNLAALDLAHSSRLSEVEKPFIDENVLKRRRSLLPEKRIEHLQQLKNGKLVDTVPTEIWLLILEQIICGDIKLAGLSNYNDGGQYQTHKWTLHRKILASLARVRKGMNERVTPVPYGKIRMDPAVEAGVRNALQNTQDLFAKYCQNIIIPGGRFCRAHAYVPGGFVATLLKNGRVLKQIE